VPGGDFAGKLVEFPRSGRPSGLLGCGFGSVGCARDRAAADRVAAGFGVAEPTDSVGVSAAPRQAGQELLQQDGELISLVVIEGGQQGIIRRLPRLKRASRRVRARGRDDDGEGAPVVAGSTLDEPVADEAVDESYRSGLGEAENPAEHVLRCAVQRRGERDERRGVRWRATGGSFGRAADPLRTGQDQGAEQVPGTPLVTCVSHVLLLR